MVADGRQFGTDRVAEVILAYLREPARRVLYKAVREVVAAFAGSVASTDDRTAIISKRDVGGAPADPKTISCRLRGDTE